MLARFTQTALQRPVVPAIAVACTTRQYVTSGSKGPLSQSADTKIKVAPEDQILSSKPEVEPLASSSSASPKDAREEMQQKVMPEDQILTSEPTIDPLVSGEPIVKPAPTPSTKPSKPIPQSSLAAQYLDLPAANSRLSHDQKLEADTKDAFPSDSVHARSAAKGKRSMSSIEKKRRNLSRFMMALTAGAAGYTVWYLGRDWDSNWERERLGAMALKELGVSTSEEFAAQTEWSKRWARTKIRAIDLTDYFNKPAWEPLLPPILPPPHQRPYTLVLELDDLLVHSQWTRENGWKTAKRPGIEEFLGYLGQFYEIVVFTEEPTYVSFFPYLGTIWAVLIKIKLHIFFRVDCHANS